jgi:hypothetical protein
MQRGSQRRSPKVKDPTPDYQNFDPIFRQEDKIHLGVSDESQTALFERFRPIVQNYKRAGYRKPSEICKLLNKAGMKTAVGSSWTPRLVWFLFKQIAVRLREARSKTSPGNPKVPLKAVPHQRVLIGNVGGLTDDEMKRRFDALRKSQMKDGSMNTTRQESEEIEC